MSKQLKVPEVAKILGRTEYTIRTYLKEGTINGYKVRTTWYVDEDDLKAYLEKLRKGAVK